MGALFHSRKPRAASKEKEKSKLSSSDLTKYIYNIISIGFQAIYKFQRNKKIEAQPKPFYSSEISKSFEILHHL